MCWGQGATLETSRGLSPGDPGKRDCGKDRKHLVWSRRRRRERRPRGATPRREPGGRGRWGAPQPGTTATSPANPRAPGSFCFWVWGESGCAKGSPHQRSTAQGGQQKTLPPGRAGSAGAPVAAASGSGLYPHPGQSSPSRPLLPSRSHSWMASRLRFLITSSQGLVGLLRAWSRRGTSIFPTPFSRPPASYPGSLRGPCGREGRERKGEWRMRGRWPGTWRWGADAEPPGWRAAAEATAVAGAPRSVRLWETETDPARGQEAARARRGGDAARGEREGEGTGRARAREDAPTCWRAALASVPSPPPPHDRSSRAHAPPAALASWRPQPRAWVVGRWSARERQASRGVGERSLSPFSPSEGGSAFFSLLTVSVGTRLALRRLHEEVRVSSFVYQRLEKWGSRPFYIGRWNYLRRIKAPGYSPPQTYMFRLPFLRNSYVCPRNEHINWGMARFRDRILVILKEGQTGELRPARKVREWRDACQPAGKAASVLRGHQPLIAQALQNSVIHSSIYSPTE